MSAISQPANIPRRIVRPKPPRNEWRDISENDCVICDGKRAVCATIVANRKAPTRLANRTTAHSRATRKKVDQLGCANKGKMAVSVFSVKRCCRPRITIKKTMLYPKLSIKVLQDVEGR